ncbi:MAG TPA: M48 family metallopeptidase [Candidatus Obscuribacterales bacterium]
MPESPPANVFACPFCGWSNNISPAALEKVQVRCARCKLPLKNRHHAKFRHLDSQVYVHPLDAEASLNLQKLPGMQALLQKMQPLAEQSYCEAFFASNSLRVSEQQYPDLYAKLVAACTTLGMPTIPHLYISLVDLSGEMGVHTFSGGIEVPFIVISAQMLDVMDEQDILIALAHELGHIHLGHMRYKVAADFMALLLSKTFKKTPLEAVADTISQPAQQALLSWRLKANLSADRSAMLVIQDQMAVYSFLMKQAGGVVPSKANLEAFVEQARGLNLQLVYNWLDKYWQQLLFSRTTYSFPVWRAAELTQWSREKLKGYGYDEIVKIFAA